MWNKSLRSELSIREAWLAWHPRRHWATAVGSFNQICQHCRLPCLHSSSVPHQWQSRLQSCPPVSRQWTRSTCSCSRKAAHELNISSLRKMASRNTDICRRNMGLVGGTVLWGNGGWALVVWAAGLGSRGWLTPRCSSWFSIGLQ